MKCAVLFGRNKKKARVAATPPYVARHHVRGRLHGCSQSSHNSIPPIGRTRSADSCAASCAFTAMGHKAPAWAA